MVEIGQDTLSERKFWSMRVQDTLKLFEVDGETGLSDEEAKERLSIYGLNKLAKDKRQSAWSILFSQFQSPLILILILAGAVTLVVGHVSDAVFILAAVVVNTLLGFYQEYKADKALAELKTYVKERVRVIRGGKDREVDADSLVPGDIVRISQGDRAAADGRLITANDLDLDEAVLTGESLAVEKSPNAVDHDALLGDQTSMVFAGTSVLQGVGTFVVCRTGKSTELGKIAYLVAEAEREETPLQSRIRKFSLKASAVLGGFTVIMFVVGVLLGHSYLQMFLTSVAVAVAVIPEGLPVSLTVILAVGVERMARRRGVIRKLIAAETLGSTSVILTDKTGTLTESRIRLSEVISLAGYEEDKILSFALTCTSAIVENRETSPDLWRISGPMIDQAIVRAAAVRSMDERRIKQEAMIEQFLPFNATAKFSVVLKGAKGERQMLFLGAPEILAAHSDIDDKGKNDLMERIDRLADDGKLILGVATRDVAEESLTLANEVPLRGIKMAGLLTFRDPIRPNVKEAMYRVERAGVKTVMLTGDHKGTALSVAREVGIPTPDGAVIEARELEKLEDDALQSKLRTARVIARVSPSDKLRIVRAYQSMGEVVAMTGDGVNDAPSIKQADVGIAMGSGTEVSRNVADLVLLDDNFETIVAAVDEGRQIAGNIRKVIVYLFSNVMDGFFLIGGALVVGLPLPLNALQILWVNFFSDSLPAIAYAFERDGDALFSGRSTLRKGLFDPMMRFLILSIGLATGVLLLFTYVALLNAGFDEALINTFMFMCFGSYTLFLSLALRDLRKSMFSLSLLSNKYFIIAVGGGLFLMLIAIYVPMLQSVFGTIALPPLWLLGAFLFGLANIFIAELCKAFARRVRVS